MISASGVGIRDLWNADEEEEQEEEEQEEEEENNRGRSDLD